MRQAVLVAPKHIEFKEVAAPKAEDLKEHQILVTSSASASAAARFTLTTDSIPLRSTP